jgi:hypothetical protein
MPTKRLAALLLLALPTLSGAAHAQPTRPSPSDPTTSATRSKVEQLFKDGVASEDKGDLLGAYTAYLAAWGLDRKWALAANLGNVEVQLGKHRDAAEHLAFALRTMPKDRLSDMRERIEQELRAAKSHIVLVTVRVDTDGAEILVDGKSAGRSPLDGDLFLEPGRRVIEARYGSRVSRAVVDAAAGASKQIDLRLEAKETAAAPTAEPAAKLTAAGSAETVPARPSRVEPVPVVVGSLIAAGGLAVGVGFLLAAKSTKDERTGVYAGLPGNSPCGAGTPNAAQCARVDSLTSDIDRQRNISTAGFVVFGVSAVATLTYVLWPRGGAPTTAVSPILTLNTAGLALHSDF